MFETIFEWLRALFGASRYWVPSVPLIIAGIMIVSNLSKIKPILTSLPGYVKNSLIVSSVGIILLLYNTFVWKSECLFISGGVVAIFPLINIVVQFQKMQHNLKKIKLLSNLRDIDYQENKALLHVKSLSPAKMTKSQKIRYARSKMYILVYLGSMRSVERIVEELGPGQLGLAHYHLSRFIVLFYGGDLEEAHEEIKRANDARDPDTDPKVQIQILINQGVSYVVRKNYHTADDYYSQAAEEYKKFELEDKTLLNLIYKNYIFNKTHIEKSEQSHETVLAEYKTYLNMGSYSDQVDYFNVELELLRQTEAPREEVNRIVESSFLRLMKGNLPLENKVMLAGSVVRIVWSAMLNPEQCLKVINVNYTVLDSLQPMARYRVHKELALLFNDLHGEFADEYRALRNNVQDYMAARAENDISEYRKSLPEEAIFARCECLKELAGIHKAKSEYDSQLILSFLTDVIELYRDNSLHIDVVKCRLDVMDEFCAEKNLDRNYIPVDIDGMRQQLKEIELALPRLLHHPERVEVGLRLSFYCLLLHEYEKCIEYYDVFSKGMLSLNHYPPWLQMYRMHTAFAVRILYLKRIIVSLQNSHEVLSSSSLVQEWFQSFPRHDGILDSILLARFVGFDSVYPIKVRSWYEEESLDRARGHAWFYFPEFELNADITYEQYSEDENSNKIFFNCDRHPFESNESKTLAKNTHSRKTPQDRFQMRWVKDSDFSSIEIDLLKEILKLIDTHVPENCPSIIELKTLFADNMMPVSAM